MKEMDDRITQRTVEEQERIAKLEEEKSKNEDRREKYYGKPVNRPKKRRHIYLFTPGDLDNDEIITLVENSPACRRDRATLEGIQAKAASAQ